MNIGLYTREEILALARRMRIGFVRPPERASLRLPVVSTAPAKTEDRHGRSRSVTGSGRAKR